MLGPASEEESDEEDGGDADRLGNLGDGGGRLCAVPTLMDVSEVGCSDTDEYSDDGDA